MNLKPNQQVILNIPEDDVWHEIQKTMTGHSPSRLRGTFIRYRTKEEMAEWRSEDDCEIQLDNDVPRIYPSEWIEEIPLEITREQLVELLGPPDATGGTSRKYPTPSIYKYGVMEYHFQGWKNGILALIGYDDENNFITIKKC
jgi:hypothetical protein